MSGSSSRRSIRRLFGGDADNFTYPRFDLDICLFRIYENGQPSRRELHQVVDERGSERATSSSAPAIRARRSSPDLRPARVPARLELPLDHRQLQAASGLHARIQQQRRGAGPIALRNLFGIENSLKATIGYQSGLLDKALMEKKLKDEQALRAAVAKNPDLEKQFGSAWDETA